MLESVSIRKMLTGIKYGLIAEVVLAAILAIIWFIVKSTLTTYPADILTFGYGGLLLTIAGCIGPGRYQKDYKILLYTPESGSSFSDEVRVSGFVINRSIKRAKIMVNGKTAGEIEFDEHGRGRTTISRKDVISEVINSIYLETDDYQSNVSDFTFFEYTEDMTEEEIEELYEMERNEPAKTLEDAQASYENRTSSRIGSIALGIMVLSLVNFAFSAIYSIYIGFTA